MSTLLSRLNERVYIERIVSREASPSIEQMHETHETRTYRLGWSESLLPGMGHERNRPDVSQVWDHALRRLYTRVTQSLSKLRWQYSL